MLELLGKGYVIDYCMALLLQEAEKKRDEMLLQYYVTDCLKVMTENTAKAAAAFGGDVNYISNRYADIVAPKPKEPEKSADEIVADIFRRAGLKAKGEGVTEENGSV